jgi:hypothetical protein
MVFLSRGVRRDGYIPSLSAIIAAADATKAAVAAAENNDDNDDPGPVVAEKVIAHSVPPEVILLFIGVRFILFRRFIIVTAGDVFSSRWRRTGRCCSRRE